MTIIEQYPTAQAAQGQAALLGERGGGATVEADDRGAYAIAVLADDAERAREVLGLVETERQDPTEGELVGAARPWLVPVLLVGMAMCLIPIAAFFITFKLSGG